MSTDYIRKDHLYHRAKDEGYRSRAAFKLKELNDRFRFLRSGRAILDLGAWPGGWLQVAHQYSRGGVIVGVDLVAIDDVAEGVNLVHGDARDESTLEAVLSYSAKGFDIVLSDMSPKLSGIKELDAAASVGCGELALWVANRVLRQGGDFVVKLFKSEESQQFFRSNQKFFEKLHRVELKSTRKTSNEFYCVGLGFRGGLKP
jgi:23S rRNA (uridine2552-2'-O)-methyltransferase